jgi:trans-2-enoyl-CoA reductase
MESKFIDDEKFSIVFPSIPRRVTFIQVLEGQKINIVSYQADDGIGLYTFSIGVLEEILSDELARKSYIEGVFRSLFSGAIDGKIYTLEQSNKNPYEISYLYTSVFKDIDWAHMGMIFLLDENTYIKITLIYPLEKIEIANEKYSEFLNSLKIKTWILR